jgi:excisionase family DNA binding protein
MSETGATETTQPGAQPGSATGETVILTVDEAADLLGITPQAVRKRIKAGTLPARRDGRAWRVFLERATNETDARETAKHRPQPETKPVAQPQAQQLAALVEPFTAPLVERIEELARENGRLQAERDAAVKASEALREENAFLRAVHDQRTTSISGQGEAIGPEPTPDASKTSAPQRAVQRSWWRFWER